MSPKRHKARLFKLLTKLKEEVCALIEHGHLEYPYKSQEEIERDIDNLTQEIERVGLAK